MENRESQAARVRICSLKLVTPNGVRIECGSIREAISLLQKLEYHFGTKFQIGSIHDSAGQVPDTPLANLAELEAAAIRNALYAEGGVKKRAAKLLGISRNTLDRRIRKHGIDVQKSVA